MENYTFKGKWITSKEFESLDRINVFHRYLEKVNLQKSEYQNCHILFRKKFMLESTNGAKIYICADDCYKLYINGSFVTVSSVQACSVIDIEKYLHKGENLIAVHTYYQGLINRVFVSGDNCHGLICDLSVDGRVVVSSDETFLYSYHSGYKSNGISGYDTQFMEIYDANSTEVGFEAVDYNDSEWLNARVRKDIDCTLDLQKTKQLVFEKIKPQFVKTDYGYFVDFGKNYVGYLNLIAKGRKNSEIILRFGQELEENGRVKYKMRANCTYEGEMILSGKSDNLNEFDYKAFRYAEIILPDGAELDENSVCLTARHYPFELNEKSFTDKKMKKIWELCTHTLKYGIQEAVMDCPDREKGYYLGDGCYIALTFGRITGDWVLFKQLVEDALKTRFISPSLLTCLNCSLIQEIAEFPLIMIIAVSIYYSITNDRTFIDKHINEFKALLDYYKNEYTDGELISKMDKWCVVEWPDNFRDNYDVKLNQNELSTETHSVINAYYYGALCAFNKIADKEIYDAEKLKKAYIDAFYDNGNCCFKDSIKSKHTSLISNVFSYAYGLCPDKKTEDKIISEFESRGVNSLNIFATFPMLLLM